MTAFRPFWKNTPPYATRVDRTEYRKMECPSCEETTWNEVLEDGEDQDLLRCSCGHQWTSFQKHGGNNGSL